MYTEQFQKVLGSIFSSFRDGFIKNNPGCNENDIERAFLKNCFIGLGGCSDLNTAETYELIDAIR